MVRTRPEVAIKKAIEARLRSIHTSIPAKVTKIDLDGPVISAKPLVQRHILNYETREHEYADIPVIPNVPLALPMSDKGGFSAPIDVGDRVFLIFSESPLDEWMAAQDNEPKQPFSRRHHDWTDAIAIPGPKPPSQGIPEDSIHEDHPVMYGEQCLLGDSTADKALAVAEKTRDRLNELVTQINNFVDQYNEHTHREVASPEVTGESASGVSWFEIFELASEKVFTNDD